MLHKPTSFRLAIDSSLRPLVTFYIFVIVRYLFVMQFDALLSIKYDLDINLVILFSYQLNAQDHVCRVTWKCGAESGSLELTFPVGYPNNIAPSVKFLSTTLDSNIQRKIIKVSIGLF